MTSAEEMLGVDVDVALHDLGLEMLTDDRLDCVRGHVDSALTRTQYTQASEDDIDALHFAAFLLHQIAKVRHCLVDGNKRAAWYLMVMSLSRWELTLVCSDDEGEALVLDVARGRLEPEDVIRWLIDHLDELPAAAYPLSR